MFSAMPLTVKWIALKQKSKTLANLTGWETKYIRTKIKAADKGGFFDLDEPKKKVDWWNNIWPGDDE